MGSNPTGTAKEERPTLRGAFFFCALVGVVEPAGPTLAPSTASLCEGVSRVGRHIPQTAPTGTARLLDEGHHEFFVSLTIGDSLQSRFVVIVGRVAARFIETVSV